jgi:hypothetical protein
MLSYFYWSDQTRSPAAALETGRFAELPTTWGEQKKEGKFFYLDSL